jgi:serine protease AprX
MKKFVVLACTVLLFFIELQAQSNRYIIRFRHKGGTPFALNNPIAYLSQRAIDRRTHYSIKLDSTDLPVPPAFISQLQSIPGVTVLNVSKWMNAATIFTSNASTLTTINALPFVQSSAPIAARSSTSAYGKIENETTPIDQGRTAEMNGNYFNYGTGASFNEIHLHNGEFLHNIGLRGQSMQIALLDGGFYQYTTLSAFDSANTNGQFLSTWDFVAREQSVAEDNAHGMSCLSTIAANIPGLFIGTSPKASFHLYRTEDPASEYPIEEFNWACGAERADSSGADVLSSSLGYGYEFDGSFPDYPYSDLNGDITISAQAADLAAKKGILVFNAAGNSGNDYWKMITTPADGDSVVAVGAVSTAGVVGSFSSYGPSADGRVKPDVAGVGVSALIMTAGNTVAGGNGTSFACPKMAGLGTCLWQGFPEFNNMRIARALKEAGSIYQTPNDRIGYGIPDVKKAFGTLLTEFATSSATVLDCKVTLTWTSKDVSGMAYQVEQKLPGQAGYSLIGNLSINTSSGAVLANHTRQYSVSLDSVSAGTISYRIRQIIDTAAATFTALYIDTANVTITSACVMPDAVRVVPNPTTDINARLEIATKDIITDMMIDVYDMKGSLILRKSSPKNVVGNMIASFPISHLAPGKYIVKVYGGNRKIGVAHLVKL